MSHHADGEKYGRLPADRRSTCSAKTLGRPSTRHDRSASRSSTAADSFYSTTTKAEKAALLLANEANADNNDDSSFEGRRGSSNVTSTSLTTTMSFGKTDHERDKEAVAHAIAREASAAFHSTRRRNQSECDPNRREKYKDRQGDRNSVDNWLSDRNESWLSDREGGRVSDREGRYSDRESSRFSDRDSRGSLLSDRECGGGGGGAYSDRECYNDNGVGGGGGGSGGCGTTTIITAAATSYSDRECGVGVGCYSDRDSQLSDYDGRVSEAGSEWSVYDVPPPPRAVSPDKRSSQP